MKFEALNLDPKLLDAIREMGYDKCTPVQEQSLPESLNGNDVAVQAQTGTGKTAVFLITALQRMVTRNDEGGSLRVLVLVPTRELAVQVEQQAVQLCKHLHYRSIAIYGGVGYDDQERALSSGAEIIVATPGRLIDFVKSKKVDFSNLAFFIIDEADRMFDMGFMEDVKYIFKFAPPKEKRQTIIVSATLDDRIRHLAYQYMSQPVEIEIEPDQITVEKVEQRLFHVSREEKFPLLLTLLRKENFERGIIFTNMKRTAEMLGFKLKGNNVDAEVITGDLDQKKRLRLIERMKSGQLKVLVATDVAARGLHIDNITHVVNFDLPGDAANYVHRIGRTARAGAAGVAYTLACEDLVSNLPPIERYIDQKIDVAQIDFELDADEAGPYQRHRRKPFAEKKGGERRGERKPHGRAESQQPPRQRGRRPERKGRNPRGQKPAEGSKHLGPKPSKQMSAEERMDLYRKKYGDAFGGKPAAQSSRSSPAPHGEHPREKRHHDHKPKKQQGHRAHRPGHHARSHDEARKPAADHREKQEKAPKKGILGRIISVFKK